MCFQRLSALHLRREAMKHAAAALYTLLTQLVWVEMLVNAVVCVTRLTCIQTLQEFSVHGASECE